MSKRYTRQKKNQTHNYGNGRMISLCWGLEGRREEWVGRGDVEGSETVLCDTIRANTRDIHLSKPTECSTSREP